MVKISNDQMNRYLERRKKDLAKCKGFMCARNFEELERVGHQLKGNGETFGFSEVTRIGKVLEEGAKKGDVSLLQRTLEELSFWLQDKTNLSSSL